MRLFKWGLLDWIVMFAAIALIWNDTVLGVSLGLIAVCVYMLIRLKFKAVPIPLSQRSGEIVPNEDKTSPESKCDPPESEDNTFLVDNEDPVRVYIDLDVDLNLRPLTNHFRLDVRIDTCSRKSLYEYRIDETEVFYRLIEDQSKDIGTLEEWDVRDGVVQESAIRERSANTTHYVRNPDEKITSLKQQVEWQRLDSWGFRGFKYFLLSKRLAKRDARRFFRQELERLKIGTAGFVREAEQYGIEKDDSALGRFRFIEGKPRPTDEEIKKLYASTESFGITQSEFESGNKIIAQIEQLLAD